jgi:hypothetical protein
VDILSRFKFDPKVVEYDGRSIRLIIKDEKAFMKKLMRKQAEIIKHLEKQAHEDLLSE